jgi:hypothetical protein
MGSPYIATIILLEFKYKMWHIFLHATFYKLIKNYFTKVQYTLDKGITVSLSVKYRDY